MRAHDPPERLAALVLASANDDVELVATVLETDGLRAELCPSMTEVLDTLGREAPAVGVLVLAAESVASSAEFASLSAWLQAQEPWSDLPVIILADRLQGGAATEPCLERLAGCGAVTLLERPWYRATLATAVRVARHRRCRQLHVRALLTESERASRAKDEFLAMLSHELRTPLNAILGWTHLLAMEPADSVLQRQAREAIERNATAQTRLVGDLLDASRIILGKMDLELDPVDLRAVVDEAVEGLQPAARAKGIVLTVAHEAPEPVTLDGDASRLRQVVWNLVSNALKFTPTGGCVEVVTRVGPHEAELRVADTGVGLAPALATRNFDRFFQADVSPSKAEAGLGLGLAIVKHFVELHGGSVGVSSPGPRQGSTFVVRLPLGSRHPAAPDGESPAPVE